MTKNVRSGAVIAAAGHGKRFGEKKQFKQLGKCSVLFRALIPFINCTPVAEIVVVVPKDNIDDVKSELASVPFTKKIKIVQGGSRRQDSVLNGCLALSETMDIIVVHDAARPFVTPKLISATIAGCEKADGCIAAVPSRDTVKKVKNYHIRETLDRNTIWFAQTPQTFHRDILIKALKQDLDATDEASMVEAFGGQIMVEEGFAGNFKITDESDWALAEKIIIAND